MGFAGFKVIKQTVAQFGDRRAEWFLGFYGFW